MPTFYMCILKLPPSVNTASMCYRKRLWSEGDILTEKALVWAKTVWVLLTSRNRTLPCWSNFRKNSTITIIHPGWPWPGTTSTIWAPLHLMELWKKSSWILLVEGYHQTLSWLHILSHLSALHRGHCPTLERFMGKQYPTGKVPTTFLFI